MVAEIGIAITGAIALYSLIHKPSIQYITSEERTNILQAECKKTIETCLNDHLLKPMLRKYAIGNEVLGNQMFEISKHINALAQICAEVVAQNISQK